MNEQFFASLYNDKNHLKTDDFYEKNQIILNYNQFTHLFNEIFSFSEQL